MDQPVKSLDVVELLASSGRWPRGTQGTVVEVVGPEALVEIDDDRGHTLEFVVVPVEVTRPIEPVSQERLLAS